MILTFTQLVLIFILSFLYCFGVKSSPFPHWGTYFKLWKNVLFNYQDRIPIFTRIRQIILLVQYVIQAPIFGYLWLLDEFMYPGYKLQTVEPIFIVGEPRSGTTLLHRTLAMDDERFLAIRHIEWRFPFITIQKLMSVSTIRRWLENRNYWPDNEAGQLARKMHPNTLFDFEEDGIFFEECFLFHFFTLFRFPYKTLLEYLDDFPGLPSRDQNCILTVHRSVIQKVMFLRGHNKIYLSKEVTSHTKISKIISLYPNAKFIIMLRKSDEFMGSLLKLIQTSTLSKTGVDIYNDEIQFKPLLIKRMQTDCHLLVQFVQGEHSLHPAKLKKLCITFKQLTDFILPTIEYIYKELSIHLPESFRSHLLLAQQAQNKRKTGYDYEKEHYEGFEMFDKLVMNYQETCISPSTS